jgi:hypothetical protein
MTDPDVEDIMWSLEDAGWQRMSGPGSREITLMVSPCGKVNLMVGMRWLVVAPKWRQHGDLFKRHTGETLVGAIRAALDIARRA